METTSNKTTKQILSLAVGKSKEYVTRKYSEDEVADLKTEFAETSIELTRRERKFKQVRANHKKTTDALKENNIITLTKIEQREESCEMEVCLVPDEEKRIMEFYHADNGEYLGQRPMKQEEMRHYMKL